MPFLVSYLNAMVLGDEEQRHSLRLRLQEQVLNHAGRAGRRVTLSYVCDEQQHGAIEGALLVPQTPCPGWGGQRPSAVRLDSSTARGQSLLSLLTTGTMRHCESRDEMSNEPSHRDTARDPEQFPAYAVVPLLGESSPRLPVGLLEVECRDHLLATDAAELLAMSSLLACARLLDLTARDSK